MSGSTEVLNVAGHLRTIAESSPHRRAVVCAVGRGADGRPRYIQLTYEQLDRESDRVAHGLEEVGIARGTRTVLMVKPGLDFLVLTYALLKIGAVLVLVDPGIGRRSLAACLHEARPEAFIGIPQAHAARTLLGWARGSLHTLVTVGRRWFWGGHRLDQLKTRCSDHHEIARVGSDEMAAILFTSGSTGRSKGVVYSFGNFAAQVDFLRREFAFRGNDVDVATFPPFALFSVALGMTAVIPDMDARRPAKADPRQLIEAIQDHGATQMFGSPALLDNLSRYAERQGIRLHSLQRVLSAGAPVRCDILERLRAVLGPDAQIHTPYGATEALPVSSIEARQVLSETREETARGGGTCVGQPVKDVTVRISRITDEAVETWSDALLVPEGEIGEIVVEGPVVTSAYYGRPRATALAKIRSADGRRILHRMGDLGRIDDKGRLWFCGRKSHRVATSAGTLFTTPCEGVFNEHPAVLRSALVGVGADGGQRPVLCVELERGLGGRARREKIRDELLSMGRKQEQTRPIQTVLFHPAFPVDRRHNAKIDRLALARWASRQLG